MADFIDNEASEVSSSDSDESSISSARKFKSSKSRKNSEPKKSREIIDSSEEEDDDDEDADDVKDLINDEEEENDGDSDSDSDEGGNKRSHDDDDDNVSSSLDSEDLDLIKENSGVRVQKKKRYKRIRQIEEDDSDQETDAGKAIARDIFGEPKLVDSDDDAVAGPASRSRPDQDNLEFESEEDDVSDENDFIVDDNDQPISKPKKRGANRYADSAMQQAQEVFGVDFDFEDADEDEDEYDEMDEYAEEDEYEDARPSQRRRRKGKTIQEVYEPAVLERYHLTQKDQTIRTEDVPERFQIRSIPVAEALEEELEKEADYIFNIAFDQPTISIQEVERAPISGKRPEFIKPEIVNALRYIRNEKLEVSFIAAYRREYVPTLCSSFDDTRDLWTIFRHDVDWHLLQKSKDTVLSLAKNLKNNIAQKQDSEETVRAIESVIERIEEANNLNSINDCRTHLKFITTTFNKKEEYIFKLVDKFGLTPEAFGENLRDDYQRNNVKQHTVRPVEEAESYIQPASKYSTPEALLEAAKTMYAKQLSLDPLVRQTVRRFYFDNAMLQVKLTDSGVKDIDESHPCFLYKYLRNKPVTSLEGNQFLNLLAAEEQKLIKMDITIEPVESGTRRTNVSPYYESLKALYFSDFSSYVTKEWNEMREEAVRTALDKLLLPLFERELREKLKKEACDKIIKTICEKLHESLRIAPYVPPSDNFEGYEDYELRNGTRICGFTFAPEGDKPCFAAVVDTEGELIGHPICLPYLNTRKRPDNMSAHEKQCKAKDRAKFKEFIIKYKPHVIAISADSVQTRYICRDINSLLYELHQHDGQPEILLEIVDNNLSTVLRRLDKTTEEFKDEYPDHKDKALLLQAICDARKLNEPLIAFANLCTQDNDILSLRMHPLQDELPQEELLQRINEVFVTITNAVGVDVNRALEHPHTADVVQFIAGLGPRKANHLLRSIENSPTGKKKLVSRQQLVSELGMTEKIFINCAGFIKLDTEALADEFPEEYSTPLDSTRIHPECYVWAKKIVCDALDYDEGTGEEANAIEEIFESPEKLDDLDLGAFAKELENQNKGRKLFTLVGIRDELNHRYKDDRDAYKPLSHEQVFAMLTKETPETLYQGKLVTCQVAAILRQRPASGRQDLANPTRNDQTNLWRCPFCLRDNFAALNLIWDHFDKGDCPGFAIGLKCRLDNGLSGFIHIRNISDKEVTNPEERVSPGQTIYARIIKIDNMKFSCELTCKSSDLNYKEFMIRRSGHCYFDDFYDNEAEEEVKKALEAKAQKATRPSCVKRIIAHSSFMNIDHATCEKKLSEMNLGACIIRPSYSTGGLIVAWKVAEGIHQLISIREEDKENPFSLGNQLYIEDSNEKEAYEDLNEIIARYIQPKGSFAREILSHKYCLSISGDDEQEVLREVLKAEKSKNPAMIHYRFCPSRKIPGKFVLGYIPGSKVHFEYLTPTKDGFRYREHIFRKLDQLIKWFKENWLKPYVQMQ